MKEGGIHSFTFLLIFPIKFSQNSVLFSPKMYQQNNSFGLPNNVEMNMNQFQQNFGGTNQQQQQWIGPMPNNQQQFVGAQRPTMMGQIKRQLEEGNAEEKENLGTKRARINLAADPPMPDEPEEEKGKEGQEGNAEDEEEEEEGGSGRSSSKTDEGSSPENSNPQDSEQIGTANNGQGATGNIGQNAAIIQHLHSASQQNFAIANSPHPMMPSTPLAHSTPMLANPNANVLRNFHQYYTPSGMVGTSAVVQMPFGQFQGIGPQQAPIGHSAQFPTSQFHPHPHQPYSSYSAQQLMASYNNYPNAFIQNQQQDFNQSTLPSSFNFISPINRDSGLGIDSGGQKELADLKNNKNENSSSTDESSIGASNLAATKNDQQIVPAVKFPPYIRQIMQNGRKQWENLEEMMFGNAVPARLSLLGNTSKYPISLAEIHRRLSTPECLNTSYLSGILRRAKNKNGGNNLRQQLADYDCGLELQTGRRKSSQVTTYTTLCEREALQLADDFGKITNDPHNGFPHQQVAEELNRRAMHLSSPEQRKQRKEDLKGTMEILRSAISIVEQSIGQETLQLGVGPMEVADGQTPTDPQLAPQTLDQFKRFARLSHCFGNRAVLICWETMLKVFGHFELLQGEFEGQSSSAIVGAGTSNQQVDEVLLKKLKRQMGNNASAK